MGASHSSNSESRHPLRVACEHGHYQEFAHTVRQVGFKALRWPLTSDGLTGTHLLAAHGTAEGLEAVVKAYTERQLAKRRSFGAKQFAQCQAMVVNVSDDRGVTPLMMAARYGHVSMVHFLLSCRADVLARDQQRCTAGHYAAAAGSVSVLRIFASLPLRTCSLLLDSHDEHGFTPLHLAAWHRQYKAVQMLCESSADIYCRTYGDFNGASSTRCILTGNQLTCNVGSTPLHLAALVGSLHTVMALMSAYRQRLQRATRGASLPTDIRLIQDASGSIPFAIAMLWSHNNVMNHLHPLVDVESLFVPRQEVEQHGTRVPKLKEIAAVAAQQLLLGQLDQAEDVLKQSKTSRANSAAGPSTSYASPARTSSRALTTSSPGPLPSRRQSLEPALESNSLNRGVTAVSSLPPHMHAQADSSTIPTSACTPGHRTPSFTSVARRSCQQAGQQTSGSGALTPSQHHAPSTSLNGAVTVEVPASATAVAVVMAQSLGTTKGKHGSMPCLTSPFAVVASQMPVGLSASCQEQDALQLPAASAAANIDNTSGHPQALADADMGVLSGSQGDLTGAQHSAEWVQPPSRLERSASAPSTFNAFTLRQTPRGHLCALGAGQQPCASIPSPIGSSRRMCAVHAAPALRHVSRMAGGVALPEAQRSRLKRTRSFTVAMQCPSVVRLLQSLGLHGLMHGPRMLADKQLNLQINTAIHLLRMHRLTHGVRGTEEVTQHFSSPDPHTHHMPGTAVAAGVPSAVAAWNAHHHTTIHDSMHGGGHHSGRESSRMRRSSHDTYDLARWSGQHVYPPASHTPGNLQEIIPADGPHAQVHMRVHSHSHNLHHGSDSPAHVRWAGAQASGSHASLRRMSVEATGLGSRPVHALCRKLARKSLPAPSTIQVNAGSPSKAARTGGPPKRSRSFTVALQLPSVLRMLHLLRVGSAQEGSVDHALNFIQKFRGSQGGKGTASRRVSVHSVHMLDAMLATRGSVDGWDDTCGVCLDTGDFVQLSCKHTLCVTCARELVKLQRAQLPPCPFCRTLITGFTAGKG